VKCIFALILVLSIFKHPKYTLRKNCIDMCARHGRGAIEICLSEKGALAKRRSGNTGLLYNIPQPYVADAPCVSTEHWLIVLRLPRDRLSTFNNCEETKPSHYSFQQCYA